MVAWHDMTWSPGRVAWPRVWHVGDNGRNIGRHILDRRYAMTQLSSLSAEKWQSFLSLYL